MFIFFFSGRFDESVIEERRQCAEDLLQFSANIPALYNSKQLEDFFKVNTSELLSHLLNDPTWQDEFAYFESHYSRNLQTVGKNLEKIKSFFLFICELLRLALGYQSISEELSYDS